MKIHFKKYLCFILALLALCGSSCKKAETTQRVIRTPAPTQTPEPVAAEGGELRLSMPVNVDITDPLHVNTEEMLAFFSLIYEGLISIDKQGMCTPAIAESWACDDSGRVWTVKIRAAAAWQDDGTMVDADDVVFTYEKLKVMGDSSYYSYCLKRIESIEKLDASTVKITMYLPGIASLYALTFPIEKSGVENANVPVGTGPYKYVYSSGDQTRLTVNDGWWRQRPYIDNITFYERESSEVALASYQAGQLDFVQTSQVSAGKYGQDEATTVFDMLTQNVEVMLVNFDNEALRDLNVRKAIIYGINRGRIITNVYMNRAQEADVLVAPDSWLYDSKYKIYDYSMEKSVELLEQAGYKDIDGDGVAEKDGSSYQKLKLRLIVNDSTDATRSEAAELIKSQLIQVGIDIEIVKLAYSAFGTENEYVTAIETGDFDLALAGFNVSRDADITEFISESGSRNYGGYSNAALTKLTMNLIKSASEANYRYNSAQLQAMLTSELPLITLYFRLNSIVYTSELKGLTDVRKPDILKNIDKWYFNTRQAG